MTKSEFRTEVAEWLSPLGYEPIYSENHPSDHFDEIHYIKDGIRAICVLEKGDAYFYVYVDVLRVYPHVAVRTGKYAIGSDKLNLLHFTIAKSREKLYPKDHLLKRIWARLFTF